MQAVHPCCRRRLLLAMQTKAELELGLAAGTKQTDMWQHLYSWGAARSPLGYFHCIPSPAGCWTHQETAQCALCSLQVRSDSFMGSLLHVFQVPFPFISGG